MSHDPVTDKPMTHDPMTHDYDQREEAAAAGSVTRTNPDDDRSAFHRGGRIEELDLAECLGLLAATRAGRLAYVTPDGPRIVPINYVVAGDSLLFRTAADNEVARWATDASVAFEVDDLDAFLQAGWSVLVTGVADEISAEEFRSLDVNQTPDPWAEGVRPLVLRLLLPSGSDPSVTAPGGTASSVTGRRVQPS